MHTWSSTKVFVIQVTTTQWEVMMGPNDYLTQFFEKRNLLATQKPVFHALDAKPVPRSF